jgi:hypothetical protein
VQNLLPNKHPKTLFLLNLDKRTMIFRISRTISFPDDRDDQFDNEDAEQYQEAQIIAVEPFVQECTQQNTKSIRIVSPRQSRIAA